MTLELERLAEALPRIGAAAVAQYRRNAELAYLARRATESAPGVEEIAALVRAAGRHEALAIPLEPPNAVHPAPGPLDSYTVVAVDGSHHELERYHPAACAVVNLGGWRIHYGPHPEAEQLYDLRLLTAASFVLDDGSVSDEPSAAESPSAVPAAGVGGALLGAYRGALETLFLSDCVRAALADDANLPLVALLDGVLLPWTIPGMVEEARHQVARMLVRALSDLRASTDGREAAIGSYVSHPRAGEVMNMLSVLSPDAASLAGHPDWLIFNRLKPGKRSAAFETFTAKESWPQKEYFGRQGHTTGFFYVNTTSSEHEPGEVARVEFPAWLFGRPGATDLLHAAVLDQCRLGRGYPIALQEAHERAVLSMEDRRLFEALVERELSNRGIDGAMAGKHMSKRVRML